jgi:predicted nucleotidyltransferase
MQYRPHPLINKDLSEIKENILATLAYFDLFNYPLTRTEIYLFLKKKYNHELFDSSLKSLADDGVIHQFDGFYSLQNDPNLISRRTEGNKKARELIRIAKTVGNILIRFPYVRGVAISGSLSKNFADEYSDIDLFIITAKNRLWIARTIMHCFKKLTFLVNKEHYFCMNYYVDEQQLEICEKNIYTAIEIGTLIPLQGDVMFERFFAANSWTRDFLPNKCMRVATARPLKTTILKSLVSWLPDNPLSNVIDNILMKITARRWVYSTKLKKVNSKGAIMAMAVDKHYSKPDPGNFQIKLLARYARKVAQVLQEHENSLAH